LPLDCTGRCPGSGAFPSGRSPQSDPPTPCARSGADDLRPGGKSAGPVGGGAACPGKWPVSLGSRGRGPQSKRAADRYGPNRSIRCGIDADNPATAHFISRGILATFFMSPRRKRMVRIFIIAATSAAVLALPLTALAQQGRFGTADEAKAMLLRVIVA